MRFQLFLASAAVLLAAIVARSAVGAAVAAAAVVFNAIVLAPLYTSSAPEARGPARLELAHVNMQREPGDSEELERELQQRRPEVFVILEPPLDWLVTFDAGIAGYRMVSAGRGPVVILTRTEVTGVEAPNDGDLPTALQFEVRLGTESVRVLAVHTLAPSTPGRRDVRDRELEAVVRWAEGTEGQRVVMGDLNAVPWSSAHEELRTAGGLRSSARGAGWQPSWPSLLGPLGIPIDDLLYSEGLTVTSRDTGPSFGSEHRSLWVTLGRAGG